MLRVLGLVVSIGLADSMNPSTIAPALYLAAGEAPLRELIKFTLGVVAVYLLGGALIVLGPGEAILALVPHPDATTRYILELVAGAAMLAAAAYLWFRRERLGRRHRSGSPKQGRSSALLGVTISVVEFPTAFPYFAAIAAIVGSGLGLWHQLILLAIYNACFAAPLVLIIVTVAIAGDQATRILGRAREFLSRHWPILLAGLALVAGLFVTLLGITGLISGGHGTVARLSKRLRHVISR
ncbi:MAG TPA: GAP family protein [Solirubrobacteraceae bacterium]|jgi:cytochrome c biogenesis protein CcdA|nr:GAP family protein [Solirubrobacteraceae bacterium]